MEKVTKLFAGLIITALAVSNLSHATTFLGPTAHLGIVKSITDESAFALAGEAGPKNLRASGTLGWEFDYHQRLKATAEYLTQDLRYSFNSGQQDQWVHQTAVGAAYQYDFRQIDPFNTLLDLSAYYSYSPSKNLSQTNGVSNRIAGATGYGFGPGITLTTLGGTTAGVDLNYDNVKYDTIYRSGINSTGLGGTARLGQAITDDVSVNVAAAVRRPYNNYSANINFANVDFYGDWTLGVFGDYTVGKNTMPSSYNVGLGATYFVDASCAKEPPRPKQAPSPDVAKHYKDYKDFKDLPPLVWKDPNPVDPEFLNWVSVPAVRMPEVYSVPEQSVVCAPPTFTGTIGDSSSGGDRIIDLATFFAPASGSIYSVTEDGVPMTPGTGPGQFSVSGTTLTIHHPGIGFAADYIITATNNCGSVPSNPFEIEWD